MANNPIKEDKKVKDKIPTLCQKCHWINRCDYKDDPIDCFLPSEEIN